MGGGDARKADLAKRRYEPKTVPQAACIGFNADRGCTDCFCIILYLVICAGMWALAFMAFKNGDPRRLLYGADVMGNLCGQDGQDEAAIKAADDSGAGPWKDRNRIVYPFPGVEDCAETAIPGYEGPTCQMLFERAMQKGLCVNKCPEEDATITWYDGNNNEPDGNANVAFKNKIELKDRLYRCIPAHLDLFAAGGAKLLEKLDMTGTLTSALRDLMEASVILVIAFVLCIFWCFLWLFILRRTVKPTVFATLFILWIAIAMLAFIFYTNYNNSKNNGGSDASTNTFLALLIGFGIGFVIYSLLLCWFCKNINIACDVIEEASKIPLSIKAMPLVPVLIAIFMVPFVCFHVAVAIYVQSCKSLEPNVIPGYEEVTAFLPTQSPSLENWNGTAGPSVAPASAANTTGDMIGKIMQAEDWQMGAHLANLFVFLWSANVVLNCGYMTLAFCAVFWYWSKPGDNKDPPAGVLRGCCWTLRYHFGTVCFGSLLVAIVQFLRCCMEIFENKMRDILGDDNRAANCIIGCIKCCLACFERFIKFVSKNAYIMTCMASDSFCPGAMRAMFLLLTHAGSVAMVTLISGYVIFFGKLQAVCITTAASWALLTQTEVAGKHETEDCILVLIVVAVLAYVIASIFCEVFGVCVDTVLLSFCHDLDVNNGGSKPYYLPDDLQRSLGKHNEMSSQELGNNYKKMKG